MKKKSVINLDEIKLYKVFYFIFFLTENYLILLILIKIISF